MMKKIDLKMLGITALVTGSVLAGSVSAFAEEGGEAGKIEKIYKSNAVIQFSPTGEGGGETTDPEEPIDPTDPTNPPVDPTDPTNPETGKPDPGTGGPLGIDFASSLRFGEQKITSTTQTYKVKPQEFTDREDGPNYVQVTDNRGLVKGGWVLTLAQDGQFKTEAGEELTGAAISFDNGHVVTVSESENPDSFGTFTLGFDEAGKGVAQNLMVAGAEQGAGTFAFVFGDNDSAASSITLTVPGKTKKIADNYATKLNWTLSDVPTGNEGEESGSEGEE
ncbi:WxL domain-containing protein [Lysinibacillus sp. NPDC056232]|uniref:WxL domain-containing protein n=1 Tax=Lysinibacillus sp. NPDC056232 TaxID=3345756 RepID=UPI0035E1359E